MHGMEYGVFYIGPYCLLGLADNHVTGWIDVCYSVGLNVCS